MGNKGVDYGIRELYEQLDNKSSLKKEELFNLQKTMGNSGVNNRLKSGFSGNNHRKNSSLWSSSIK